MKTLDHLRGWTRASDDVSAIDDTLFTWYRRWHIIFALIALVAGIAALIDPALDWPSRALGTLLLCALGGWFWARIARRLHDGVDEPDILVYFLAAFPLFIALINLHPSYMLLSFIAYWQLYAYLRIPAASFGAVLLSASIWVSVNEGDAFSPVAILIGIAALLISTMFAAYIESIGREAEKRQTLIEQLRATRDELVAAERQAGMLEERQRLAGEIHDTLAQGFTSIVMHLEAADSRLGGEQAAARNHLDQARQTARESLAEARRFVLALRPALLDSTSIDRALSQTVATWSERTDIPATFTIAGDIQPLSRAMEVTLLRVCQESLANVQKHAAATRVTVTLTYMDDEVILDIRDDGQGFASVATSNGDASGYGLVGMRKRVDAEGGELTIESTPGTGTSVAAALPLTELSAPTPAARAHDPEDR